MFSPKGMTVEAGSRADAKLFKRTGRLRNVGLGEPVLIGPLQTLVAAAVSDPSGELWRYSIQVAGGALLDAVGIQIMADAAFKEYGSHKVPLTGETELHQPLVSPKVGAATADLLRDQPSYEAQHRRGTVSAEYSL